MRVILSREKYRKAQERDWGIKTASFYGEQANKDFTEKYQTAVCHLEAAKQNDPVS